MKFVIKHEIRGRIRVHLIGKAMSFAQADTLQYQFEQMKDVTAVKVQERTMDVTICYIGSRKHIITALGQFSYDKVEVPEVYLKNSGREMNRFYWDKLVDQTVVHFVNKIFLPAPLRAGIATVRSVKYMTVKAVWTIADIFNGLMALPNMIALFALSGVVAKETKDFFERHKRGEIK